jgi:hypothetical protein
MIADLVLADVVVEVGNLYFVEAVVEGRHRCSMETAVGVEERSGHSSAVRSQVKTEMEGSRVIVEEGIQATLAEEVERLLPCELGASRCRL